MDGGSFCIHMGSVLSKVKVPKRLLSSFHFSLIRRSYYDRPFTMLDVGCGNHSAFQTKSFFPKCRYYGIDLSREYGNDENDFKSMSGFYEMDLTKLDFGTIPDAFFDVMVMRHVLEHLSNGDQVLVGLLNKLKVGGHLYIEWPSSRSITFPSRANTLNFFDDPTHCKQFSVAELSKILDGGSFKIIRSGTKNDPKAILLTPVLALRSWTAHGRVQGPILWDLLGFAEFIYAKKE